MTGSTTVVTLLNWLGHGLLATQVGEIEAGMSQQFLSRQRDSARPFVPSNITPSSFVHLAWDNNDIIEETLSGLGTTHCTNGIAIRRQVHIAKTQESAVPAKPSARQRRIRSVDPPPAVAMEYMEGGGGDKGPSQSYCQILVSVRSSQHAPNSK